MLAHLSVPRAGGSSELTGARATKTAGGEEAGCWAAGLAFSWSLVVMWLAHVGFMFNAVLIIRKIFSSPKLYIY